jgi:protein phosphatase
MMADSDTPTLHWAGCTDVGRFRSNNEDAYLALAVDGEGVRRLGKYGDADLQTCDYVVAVSDGMGGANAGEFASQVAVDKITSLFPRSFRSAAGGLQIGFQDILTQLFAEIHAELQHLGQSYEELSGMGATLSLCWVRPGWLYFCHVGDSRIYHFPAKGALQQLTQDHTHVGWQYAQGQLNERQAREHPGRNALQQALGGKTQVLNPCLGAVAYEPGDQFLLCTDGLVEGLWDRGMARILSTAPQAAEGTVAERLVQEAVATDGRDNTTALVLSFR